MSRLMSCAMGGGILGRVAGALLLLAWGCSLPSTDGGGGSGAGGSASDTGGQASPVGGTKGDGGQAPDGAPGGGGHSADGGGPPSAGASGGPGQGDPDGDDPTGGGGNVGTGELWPPAYWEQGPWRGYLWTSSASATIEPSDFPSGAKPPYCVTGTGTTTDVQGRAALGWNIAQAEAEPSATELPEPGLVKPTGTGVALKLSRTQRQVLQLELRGGEPGGALVSYCAELELSDATEEDVSATIPWSGFTRSCQPTGEAFDPAHVSLQSIAVVAPAPEPQFGSPGATRSSSFAFCLSQLEPYE